MKLDDLCVSFVSDLESPHLSTQTQFIQNETTGTTPPALSPKNENATDQTATANMVRTAATVRVEFSLLETTQLLVLWGIYTSL